MIRKYVLPVIAFFGLAFAIVNVVRGSQPVPAAPPVADPAKAPFASTEACRPLPKRASTWRGFCGASADNASRHDFPAPPAV